MRSSSPIGKPTVIAPAEGSSSIQGVHVPKVIPEANLRPMSEVLSSLHLDEERDSSAEPLERAPVSDADHVHQPGLDDIFLSGERLPGEAKFLQLTLIRRGKYQPRRKFDPEKLGLLANTIEDKGLNNAIIVRPLADGTYELIAGERRFLAHELLRKAYIYALVRNLSDAEAAILSVTDNDAREDLTEFERGASYKKLLDDKVVQSQAELSRRVGRSMATISRCLAYFKLPEGVISLLEEDPDLIGNRVVSDMVALADKGHIETVLAAANRIKEGASQDSAINWAKGEIRRKTSPQAPVPPRQIDYKERTQLDARIDGRKLILTPPKGIDPAEVLAYIEEMLKTRS